MGPLSSLRWLRLYIRRYRTRRELRDLSPELLCDLGIDDAARTRECARWLWQGIAARDDDEAPKQNARGRPARASLIQSR
ncbi:MAG: DUF1127 domain-containing protein [Proteobacteria bacterium]|nr:DUF1127 domain-containing protein [Pseudomonadota bacterium]